MGKELDLVISILESSMVYLPIFLLIHFSSRGFTVAAKINFLLIENHFI